MITYLDNLTRQTIGWQEEISTLGTNFSDLAKEKECPPACLDKKSKNIASCGESLAMKVCSENCGLTEMFELEFQSNNRILSNVCFPPQRAETESNFEVFQGSL